jgi:hypothetical protein
MRQQTRPESMEALNDTSSKPSTSKILKRFYTKVISLEEHLQQTVSTTRFHRMSDASRKIEEIRKLIATTLVCSTPKPSFHLEDDNDVGEHTSHLSIGDHATQSEVSVPQRLINVRW